MPFKPKFQSISRLLSISGLGFLSFGIFMYIFWAFLFCYYIPYRELALRPNSRSFLLWKSTPIPIVMKFYMFNWTNHERLGEETPQLEQLGPYVFNMKEDKTNIVWNDNGTITYNMRRFWYFDQENSNGKLSDEVLTLNAVAVAAARGVRDWSYFMQRSLSMTITSTKQKIHIKQRVGDLLFTGYSDPLMDFAQKLPSFAGVDLPFDKFAWFYTRNGSSTFEGVFNMDTGVNDISQIGKLHRWNYEPDLPYFEDSCALIKGTAGQLFAPGQSETSSLEFFSADLCRSVTIHFEREVDVHGVRGLKYVGDEYMMDNGTLDSGSECFCDGECVPRGLLNLTSCRHGAPGFVSFPNFYLADDFYLRQVSGLHPDPDKHQLYITLEPRTGIPLDVAARFQVNMLMSTESHISLFKNAPRLFFPMMWFEQRATISEDLAQQIQFMLWAKDYLIRVASWVTAVGLILLLVGLYKIHQDNFRRKKQIHHDITLSEKSNQALIKNGTMFE